MAHAKNLNADSGFHSLEDGQKLQQRNANDFLTTFALKVLA